MRFTILLSLVLLAVVVVSASYSRPRPQPVYIRLGSSLYAKLKALMPKQNYVDLYHLMDRSGSVKPAGFNNAKLAAKFLNFILHFERPIGVGKSRVACSAYSSLGVDIDMHFGQFNNLALINNAITGYSFTGGLTPTPRALRLAFYEFFVLRPSSNKRILWFYSDGHSNVGGSPVIPASWLKRSGVTICAMGIGPKVDMIELNQVASPGCVCRFPDWLVYRKSMQWAADKIRKEKIRSGGSAIPR